MSLYWFWIDRHEHWDAFKVRACRTARLHHPVPLVYERHDHELYVTRCLRCDGE